MGGTPGSPLEMPYSEAPKGDITICIFKGKNKILQALTMTMLHLDTAVRKQFKTNYEFITDQFISFPASEPFILIFSEMIQGECKCFLIMYYIKFSEPGLRTRNKIRAN